MNPGPRVLQLVPNLNIGGMEKIVVDLARGLPAQGFQPLVATLEPGGGLVPLVEELGIPVVVLGKKPGLDPGLVPRLAGLIREQDIDLLHAHNPLCSFYAGLAGRLGSCPVISSRHGVSFGTLQVARKLWLRRLGGWLTRHTICVGEKVYQVARQVDRLPASRLSVILNGVDTEVFRPDAQARADLRRELDLPPEAPVVISVGRLSAEKDYATLLSALAALPLSDNPTRLVLVGDGPEMARLAQQAQAQGTAGQVLLAGARRDVNRFLAMADVFVLSSLSEGNSLSLMEAMSCGLPVVATQVGGNGDLVAAGATGLLVPPDDAPALAGALQGLLDDPQGRQDMGRAGRRRVLAKFSSRVMLEAHAALFRRFLT